MDAAKIISELQAELERLKEERDGHQQKIFEIEEKIEAIKDIFSGLEFLGNPESKLRLPRRLDMEGLGLQEAILKALGLAQRPLSPVEIREVLTLSGVTATSPKNLLIAIHTALGRMEDRLEKSVCHDGKPAYTIKREPRTLDPNKFPPEISAFMGKGGKK